MRHDQAYKALFSHPQAVQDLLREFVAERLEGGREWVRRLDFSTLEPLPTERIDATLRGRANDLVWRVRFRDAAGGPQQWHSFSGGGLRYRFARLENRSASHFFLLGLQRSSGRRVTRG